MRAVIHSITPGSAAESAGLRPGDEILAINGRTNLEDMFDYQFEMMGAETVMFQYRRVGEAQERREKEEGCLSVRKDPDDADCGIVFTTPIFTPIKTCVNACPFCFIDQQPAGLRDSLYVKDDDYRLSYFNNTYITLTNLSKNDRDRIAHIRPGPLYISVHSTVPEIREKLLLNPKAGKIMAELCWLKSLEIPFHCQVVVCPGYNEAESLTRTLHDLAGLRPEALSVAVVPIGLTQYRAHLPQMNPVDMETAREVIQRVEAFNRDYQAKYPEEWEEAGPFVFLSDEFYFKAGLPLPGYDAYADFPQLEDGVGTARLLMEDFFAMAVAFPNTIPVRKNVLMLTGKLAAMTLQPIAARLNEIEGFYADVLPVTSRFWGDSVGVAGLVTGQDILEAVAGIDLSGYAFGLIPGVMLKHGSLCEDSGLFLDGMTVADVSERLGLPLRVVEDPYSASALLEQLEILR